MAAANEILKTFAADTSVRLESGYVIVDWTRHGGERLSRRWMTRGQDWYPVWHRHWGHGGTACCALSQLVRWINGRPVYGVAMWKHWASDGVQLLRTGDPSSAITRLIEAGYPLESACVLCGESGHVGDWWSLGKVSGPCCGMTLGCKQKGGA